MKRIFVTLTLAIALVVTAPEMARAQTPFLVDMDFFWKNGPRARIEADAFAPLVVKLHCDSHITYGGGIAGDGAPRAGINHVKCATRGYPLVFPGTYQAHFYLRAVIRNQDYVWWPGAKPDASCVIPRPRLLLCPHIVRTQRFG